MKLNKYKFKAWNSRQEKFIFSEKFFCLSRFFNKCERSFINESEHFQFTGKKDKNGKEIYERCDIVKFKYNQTLNDTIELIGLFNFNEDELRYEIEIFNNPKYVVLYYKDDAGIMFDFEIIGDIYNNFELIKQ
jgi:uncharacterized phage protein (TIGR01671 family)